MKTLDQLIIKTPKNRIDNAKYVRFSNLKTGYDKAGLAYIAGKARSIAKVDVRGNVVPNHDKHQYVTIFKFLDKKLRVKVSCSCADFMYRAEVALSRAGAADVYYSNGEMPEVTNPRLIPYICKHLVAFRILLKQKYGF